MEIITLTPTELQRLIAEEVQKALAITLPDAIRQGTMPPTLTKPKLEDWTGWSSRTIEYKKAKGEIPYIRRGRLVLFPTDEIMAYLREGYVPARTAA